MEPSETSGYNPKELLSARNNLGAGSDLGPGRGYGFSWGGRGFRIGRSQYGNWWISVGLPFGFRITKVLGRNVFASGGSQQSEGTTTAAQPELPRAPASIGRSETPNERLLRQLLEQSKK